MAVAVRDGSLGQPVRLALAVLLAVSLVVVAKAQVRRAGNRQLEELQLQEGGEDQTASLSPTTTMAVQRDKTTTMRLAQA